MYNLDKIEKYQSYTLKENETVFVAENSPLSSYIIYSLCVNGEHEKHIAVKKY